jgi:UDP-glucuronate decarboxylase
MPTQARSTQTDALWSAAVDAAVQQLAPLAGAPIHVSGASGFLATNLVALLHEASERGGLGLRLYASARRPASDVPLFRFLGVDPTVEWEVAPVESSTLPDEPGLIVVHTASYGAPGDYMAAPLATFRANTDGLIGLFERAARVGAGHVAYFSSAEVYGQPPDSAIPTPEGYDGAPPLASPRSVYGESKRMAEVLGAVMSAEHGIPFTALRPWNLYGPGQRATDGRVPMDFMRQALSDGAVRLASDGSPRRCPCFVWDGLLQVIACLAPADGGAAYNVGNPAEELTMLELARRCAAVAGLAPAAVAHDPQSRAGGLARCVPDVSRVVAQADPGLPSPTPLVQGLAALREWADWSLRDA